jgi:ABC-type Fe3+-hydroxamate transport system substrate-binding protein
MHHGDMQHHMRFLLYYTRAIVETGRARWRCQASGGLSSNEEESMLTDALGRTLELAAVPRRMVSLVPSLTEYLFAIGLGARLVAVTDFCSEPAEQVAHLPRVRGTKNPHREQILALQPDLVLASKEENRQRDIEALAAAGLAVYVTDICSVRDALEQLAALAHVLDAEQGAAPLLHGLRQEWQQRASQPAAPPLPRVLCFIWREPWMAVGSATYADDLLRLCGAENLATAMEGRYPRATLESFLQAAPDIILLPDEPFRFTEADRQTFAAFPQVPAVRNGRIYLCNGQLLTWYGHRTLEALRFFPRLLAAGDGA